MGEEEARTDGWREGGREGGLRLKSISADRLRTAIISVSAGPVVRGDTAEFLDKEE